MKIVYFAALRREIGIGEESVSPPADVATVAQLIAWLKTLSPRHAKALSAPRLMAAVNQDHAALDAPVAAADEVAFFPPVTGG